MSQGLERSIKSIADSLEDISETLKSMNKRQIFAGVSEREDETHSTLPEWDICRDR